MNTPSNAFADNRAEELGHDLWGRFIVPPFFDELALDTVRKPLLIEGGRGCGKTTLLRYLSHRTQLSEMRELTAENIPKQLGLYLRADTQYLRTFRGSALPDQEWERVFDHALCLMLLSELLSAFSLLSKNEHRQALFRGISTLDLSVLRDYDPMAGTDLNAARHYVQTTQRKLAMWLNNPDACAKPLLLPLRSLLLAVIQSLRDQVRALHTIDFFVFVDEYENLLPYQMRIINTYLKHSEPPLIFHVAVKRSAMSERGTIGAEQLQEPSDFRRIDIEEKLEPRFATFAAELFFFRLIEKGIALSDPPVSKEQLCDENSIRVRYSDENYKNRLLKAVEKALPSMESKEIAQYIFNDDVLIGRARKAIQEALVRIDRSSQPEHFLREAIPTASICTLALLHQGKKPKEIIAELDRCEAGQPSKFTHGEWIHHYFLGTVLYLYLPLERPCIAYAGFSNFLKLSRCNIRHFIELCHLSLADLDATQEIRVPVEKQAAAARSASSIFVKETAGAGDHGYRLYQIVNTLGQIYRLSQQRAAQSEPERTHFSITKGEPSESTKLLLRECQKWSVFFATRETKVKDARYEGQEYVFNPIFAPYFGISFNKGRRLELDQDTLEQLFTGSRDRLDAILKDYKSRWNLSESDQLPLI
ncbi:MAG: hypothetical protein E6Q50_14365 [Lysobacter sp.]|nr:MAG: hypothetical protein E6Q50_14365 [Lysobacter sp.]